MSRTVLDELAAAAHDAWYAEKRRRLADLGRDSWPSESGEEQLVPWADLSEPVREFDRIVVRAILGVIGGELRAAVEDMGHALSWVAPKRRDPFIEDHVRRIRLVHELGFAAAGPETAVSAPRRPTLPEERG